MHIFMEMPLWGQMIVSAVLGVAIFIVATSDDETKWYSAHQLGKRNNIAWLILAIAGIAVIYGIIPMFTSLDRIVIEMLPYWVSIRSYLPYLIGGLVAVFGSIVWIKKNN